jgi:hypothetical protein
LSFSAPNYTINLVQTPASEKTIRKLNQHPLNLIQRHFFAAAIVELRGAGAGVVRHLRRFLQRPAVFQVRCHARRPKRVVADLRRDIGRSRSPLNHRIGVCLGQGVAGELARRAAVGLEQQRLRIARQPCAVDIGVKVGFKVVVARTEAVI